MSWTSSWKINKPEIIPLRGRRRDLEWQQEPEHCSAVCKTETTRTALKLNLARQACTKKKEKRKRSSKGLSETATNWMNPPSAKSTEEFKDLLSGDSWSELKSEQIVFSPFKFLFVCCCCTIWLFEDNLCCPHLFPLTYNFMAYKWSRHW